MTVDELIEALKRQNPYDEVVVQANGKHRRALFVVDGRVPGTPAMRYVKVVASDRQMES
jgi:hypothetical protein